MGALMNLSLSVPVIAGWGAWLTVGLLLLIWARRAHDAELTEDAIRSRPIPVRPKSGVRTPKPSSAPADAFGELAAMLEPETDLSVARRPGD